MTLCRLDSKLFWMAGSEKQKICSPNLVLILGCVSQFLHLSASCCRNYTHSQLHTVGPVKCEWSALSKHSLCKILRSAADQCLVNTTDTQDTQQRDIHYCLSAFTALTAPSGRAFYRISTHSFTYMWHPENHINMYTETESFCIQNPTLSKIEGFGSREKFEHACTTILHLYKSIKTLLNILLNNIVSPHTWSNQSKTGLEEPWTLSGAMCCPLQGKKTRMWANAQRDGRPAEDRWRTLFNTAKFGWRSLLDLSLIHISEPTRPY